MVSGRNLLQFAHDASQGFDKEVYYLCVRSLLAKRLFDLCRMENPLIELCR